MSAPYRTLARVAIFFKADFTMSSYSDPRLARTRPRFTLQATFPSNEERGTPFHVGLKLLQPVGAPPLDNHGLLCAMFDAVERSTRQDLFPG